MPKFEDKQLIIVDETEDMFGVRVGPEIHYFDRACLQEKIKGTVDVKELLLNNMAVKLSLSGEDAYSKNMKTVIESSTFKGPQ